MYVITFRSKGYTVHEAADGLSGIARAVEINPAVIIKGTKLGITEIKIIRGDIKRVYITIAINIIASNTLSNKFCTKNSFPFKNIKLLPVKAIV